MQLPIYNPLSHEFSVKFDYLGNGVPQEFTVGSQEIAWFDKPVFEHVKKHLTDAVLNERGRWNEDQIIVRTEIEQEITEMKI